MINTHMADSKPLQLELQAKQNPSGWVYEIDWVYGPDDYVPPEAIVGAWKVDDNGNLTDIFEKNSKHTPVRKAARPPREYMLRVAESDRRTIGYKGDEWVLETDPAFDHTFPNTPPEGFVGSWYIDKNGMFTGDFRPNPNYSGNIIT